jgi:hypothetical protein
VDLESRLNSLRVKRLNRLDLPTPESPINTTVRALVCPQAKFGPGVGKEERGGDIHSRQRYL